jgi:DUF971 family protein
MAKPVPVEINHVRGAGLVRVTWDDRHVSEYKETYLRGYCPCALCQGHGGGIKFVEPSDARLVEIQGVGHYAVQFNWADGHNTGIYTFDYLRALCPCARCVAAGDKPSERSGRDGD